MILNKLLLQAANLLTDTVAAGKIKAVTDPVKAHVDSLTNAITNPDSLAALSPSKVASELKNMDWGGVITNLSNQIISLGLRIVAAIFIFYVGKFIINKIYSVVRAIMVAKNFDKSLITFLLSFIRITLLFLLIITVIGVLGIETSSFIAIFASAGVAIGLALSGTLQNFAGGVLILLIKPYKVGDYIEFGNYKGTVKEIQIFNTIIITYNNERVIIPNGGLSTSTINNYSAETYRRLEWRVSISYGDDVELARKVALKIIGDDERILKSGFEAPEDKENENTANATSEQNNQKPKTSFWKRLFHRQKAKAAEWQANQDEEFKKLLPKKDYTPYVAIDALDDSAVVIVVRAWARFQDYWGVYYDVLENIYKQFPANGLHFPFPQMDVHVKNTEKA